MGDNVLVNGIYLGYKPLILTFDPNLQRDIQVYIVFQPISCEDDTLSRLNEVQLLTFGIGRLGRLLGESFQEL